MKIVNSEGLNDAEQQFVNQYLMNGGNARAAFLACKPTYSPAAASSAASKLMKKPEVMTYLELRRTELASKEEIQFSYLVQNLKKIISDVNDEEIERDKNGRIVNKPDRQAALKAIETLSKLGGYMDKKSNVTIQSTGEINISFGDWSPETPKALEGTQDSKDSVDFTEYDDLTEEEE